MKSGYDVLVAQGVLLAMQGDRARAADAYTAAIALDAQRPDAHFDLGLSLAAQAKFHEAAEQFTRANAPGLAARYAAIP